MPARARTRARANERANARSKFPSDGKYEKKREKKGRQEKITVVSTTEGKKEREKGDECIYTATSNSRFSLPVPLRSSSFSPPLAFIHD